MQIPLNIDQRNTITSFFLELLILPLSDIPFDNSLQKDTNFDMDKPYFSIMYNVHSN